MFIPKEVIDEINDEVTKYNRLKLKDDIQIITAIMSNDIENFKYIGKVDFLHIVKALKNNDITKEMMDFLRFRADEHNGMRAFDYQYLNRISAKYGHKYDV